MSRTVAPGVGYDEALNEAAKSAISLEAGVSKATLTISGAAITASVGLAFAHAAVIPRELVSYLVWGWSLLAASSGLVLLNWASSWWLANRHAVQLRHAFEGRRVGVDHPDWPNRMLTWILLGGVACSGAGVGLVVYTFGSAVLRLAGAGALAC